MGYNETTTITTFIITNKKASATTSSLAEKASAASTSVSNKVSTKVDEVKEKRAQDKLTIVVPQAESSAIKGGFVVAIGNNESKQLVQGPKGSTNYKQMTAIIPSFLVDIAYVSVGHDHIYFVSKDGKFYYSGSNKDGQLGAMSPSKDDQLVQFTNLKIGAKSVVCGHHHTMFLCDKGALYSTGRADMLGIKTDENKYSPNQVITLANKKIDLYATGPKHSYAVDDTGNIYAWGRSDLLGLGQFVKVKQISVQRKEPTLIEHTGFLNFKIVQIACGDEHTLCLLQNGAIYAWGRGEEGQLGNGVKETRQSPIPIDSLAGLKLKSISAGAFNSAAITDDGECYVWGQYHKSILKPEPLNTGDRKVLKNVAQISQSGYYNILYTTTNDVYTFGIDYKLSTEAAWIPTKHHIDDPFLLTKKITQVVASSSNFYLIVYEGSSMEPKFKIDYTLGNDKTKSLQPLAPSQYRQNMNALLAKPSKPSTSSTTTSTTSTTSTTASKPIGADTSKRSSLDSDSDDDDDDEEDIL
ncbi:hypothetical protein DFA_08386 [Cavenderia fasciculata]|uniref:Regulator of chromosome condensation domain-containing protein n=1 Tax=Cavenderia fasciculata TaxID=261658 RepID=F4Q5Y2_CACFS|nr:uncharacterized protein DFA_08386 [Cavenderia fasciculata]EGG17391.1 hypothetical protein DFA_08386 [Cavenderia fasciculata]|eukprot:XP_004355875.1 hypothetical protein DFA_08386 [Cavenderia fasciculata]